MFGLFAFMATLILGFIMYHLGRYVKLRYDSMKLLVKKQEKEIELLTDLWKIDESEIEWIEPISRGILFIIFNHIYVLISSFRWIWRGVGV